MEGEPKEEATNEGTEARAPVSCDRARRLLAQFLQSPLTRDEDREFRSHILECAPCKGQYREAITGAARMGRAIREKRVEDGRIRRQADARRRVIAAGMEPRRRRFFGLRLVLVPALMIVLLTQLGGFGKDRTLTVEWRAGEVDAGGTVLSQAAPEREVYAGDWCLTDPGASARILGDDAEFLLGSATQLRIEDPETERVRLQSGRLITEGSSTVVCQYGVLDVEDGKVELEVDRGRFALRCVSGSAKWIGSGGVRELSAGDETSFGAPGSLAEHR